MVKPLYRFYGKRNCIIMNINTKKQNGLIEIVPAYNPNRQMRGPVDNGSKIYNYNNKKLFSISHMEALKLLNDYKQLETQPNYQAQGIIHDRSKVFNNNQQKMITILTAGKYKNAYTISISYKINNENIYENYLFHNEEEYSMFKNYLNFIAFHLAPLSTLMESFFEEVYGYGYRDKLNQNNKKYNNN